MFRIANLAPLDSPVSPYPQVAFASPLFSGTSCWGRVNGWQSLALTLVTVPWLPPRYCHTVARLVLVLEISLRR